MDNNMNTNNSDSKLSPTAVRTIKVLLVILTAIIAPLVLVIAYRAFEFMFTAAILLVAWLCPCYPHGRRK